MGRGFNTTFGVAITDSIVITNGNRPVVRTYHVWVNHRNASNTGRIFSLGNDLDYLLISGTTPGLIDFARKWTSAAEWATHAGVVPFGEWTAIGVTYDGSSTANKPTFYLNGSDTARLGASGAVDVLVAASGTLDVSTGNSLTAGNRFGASVAFDGMIAEFAIWDDVALTDAEFTAIYNGKSAGLVRPHLLTSYYPMKGAAPEFNSWKETFDGTLTGTKVVQHPPLRPAINLDKMAIVTIAPTFKSAWARSSNLPVLGTGTF